MPKPSEFAQLFTLQLNAKFEDYDFSIESGSKFDRIVRKHKIYQNSSNVHAFVEKLTGHVYKAAGYKAPAKGVRYTDVFLAAEAADVHGGYLYK